MMMPVYSSISNTSKLYSI